MNAQLMTVTYADSSRDVYLQSYADMVVYDTSGRKKSLCAIRFGGYPEQVSGMAAAICGGGTIEVDTGTEQIVLHPLPKQYKRALSHDGVYAEATLIAEDEIQKAAETNTQNPGEEDEFGEQAALGLPPRNCFIYVSPGDDKALFDAIDRKTGVPLIPEFQDYLLSELKRAGILRPLITHSASFRMDAWVLRCSDGDRNIINVVENGVRTGLIAIPGADGTKGPSAFDGVESVTGYLSAYGPQIAQRIQNLFVPLFDPEKEPLSPEVMAVNETIREKAGYPVSAGRDAAREIEGTEKEAAGQKSGGLTARRFENDN
jgi:hypothetical protein